MVTGLVTSGVDVEIRPQGRQVRWRRILGVADFDRAGERAWQVGVICDFAAIDVLETDPDLMARLWENTRFFKAGLQTLGFNTGMSQSPITPVIAGEGSRAMKLSDRLFEEGVFAQGIAFPTVARDKARVRTIVTATHTQDELQFALDAFQRVGKELGLI